jgi:type I restriction-modification system DNA methylase subunit
MPLFQKSVLNKFIKSQDTVKIEAAYQRFSDNFQKAERQAEIRSMKEEEYQDGFLDDLFVNILGYIKRPNSGFNLVREKKNEADSKKADGAILKNDMPLAVIELKGTDTTDLDKVTNQGFGYKYNHKECVYVVISNFEKLRFFIHHAVDYIEFNLFTLSKEDFTTLWLCLHSDNLLDNIPAKIKAESVVKEEDITKNLYKDYSTFKQELWQSIVSLNPEGDPLMFYKKTQKLIDRFLFIFFAEDAGLLPPNSISRMVERWQMLKDEDAYKPLYDIFKQYFGYINTGRPGKTPQDEIFAYNGGLMLEDEILESITISDDVLLKHVSRLTTYDFSSEVDVNILGHIFENSLNDIEAVTAELEGQEIDKSKTKRKKDGVFYTPKYITKYIVDNTVGKLCDEKKVELNIIDEEYAKGRTNRKKETLKQLDENLQAYRNWLLNITICDPACGSGAFLNQALEYLIEEHRYIDELESQLLGAGFTFPGVESHILENNIFGVDINEESIEIAKLSLWLRTAQRGRKLTSLNNNIKCGNSLIDDPEVAGDKAFNWQQEFPTVFEKSSDEPGRSSGFDVVIGNPPYVNIKELDSLFVEWVVNNYELGKGQTDLYALFIEKGIAIKKNHGFISYIIPDSINDRSNFKDLRKLILDKTDLISIISMNKVFADANVGSTIFISGKNELKNIDLIKSKDLQSFQGGNVKIYQSSSKDILNYENYNFLFIDKNVSNLIDKVYSTGSKLGSIAFLGRGEEISKKSSVVVDKAGINSFKFISGEDFGRYYINNPVKFIEYSNIKKEIEKIYSKKIIVRQVGDRINASIDYNCLITPQSVYSIKPLNDNLYEYILGILNSQLFNFLYQKKYKTKELFPRILLENLKDFPIFLAFEKTIHTDIISLVLKMIGFQEEINANRNKIKSLIISDFNINPSLKKIEEFYTLTWSEFEKELNKNKIILLGVQKEDWLDRFERFKKQALDLKYQIDQTDKEIDRMVYELYGLTQEEIQIVENN